jgi:hypothetical protein
VLAFGGGGALHTVVPGVTGEHFSDCDPGALARVVDAFDPGRYEPSAVRAHALRWDRAGFARGVDDVLRAVHEQRPTRPGEPAPALVCPVTAPAVEAAA